MELSSFSPCGNYLAHFTPSGIIRIWETDSNYLKQEFTPSSHLSSQCLSTVWVPVSNSPGKMNKKKKRKFRESQVWILVLGTEAGQIFFYSLAEGDVVGVLKGQNRHVVGLTAFSGTDLYSGAENVIIHWSIPEKAMKSKWKCKEPITYMLISDDNKILFTALSSSVVCWNVEDHSILRRFKDHKSNINGMCLNVSPSGEKYLFTSAAEDRIVNVRNLTSKSSVSAVFTLPDIPSSISCNINSNGLITFVTVARNGSLHIYSLQLNGKCATAIKPKTTVVVTHSETNTYKKATVVPIIAAKVLEENLKIGYGGYPVVNCECIDLSTNESELFLVRRDPRRPIKSKEESVKKIKKAETTSNVECLTPEVISSVKSRREREAIDNVQKQTLATVLEQMNLSSSKEQSGDALAHLLVQGLNSQDKDILRSVLYTQNERKIKSTVERLPAQAVLPLLKILISLIQGRTWMSQVGAMWLQAILRTHVSQLLADESCTSVLSPLMGLVERRLTCLGPLCQLKGRLDLLLDQTSTTPTEPVVDVQPLLVYQDIDSPVNSNCLLEEENEDSDIAEDDDKFSDLLDEDMSPESDEDEGDENDDDNVNENKDNEDLNKERANVNDDSSEEEMDTS